MAQLGNVVCHTESYICGQYFCCVVMRQCNKMPEENQMVSTLEMQDAKKKEILVYKIQFQPVLFSIHGFHQDE